MSKFCNIAISMGLNRVSTSQETAENKPARPELEWILHLSDIHFHTGSGDIFDLDSDLRNELLLDAHSFAQEHTASPHAVLISGDIAYSGSHDEYSHAKEFLAELCEKQGHTIEIVWCVPGNHDIDRQAIEHSPILRDQHERLKQRPVTELNDILRDYTQDSLASEVLYTPLTE